MQLVAPSRRTLRGRILDGGRSVPRATVSIFPPDGFRVQVLADENGTFQIDGVPEGPCQVSVAVEGAFETHLYLSPPEDASQPFDIELPDAAIAGRVPDARTGEGAPGVRIGVLGPLENLPAGYPNRFLGSGHGQVSILNRDGGPPAFGWIGPTTRADGSFLAPHLPPGRYRVSAYPYGVNYVGDESQWAEVEARAGFSPTDPDAPVFRLQPGCRVRGIVVNERSEPLQATVSILGPNAPHQAQAQRDGRFEAQGVAPGTYDVTVRAREHGQTRLRNQVVSGDAEWTIVVPRGGTLEVRVTRAGQPVTDAWVAVRHVDGLVEADVPADDSGVARFEAVPPGRYAISVSIHGQTVGAEAQADVVGGGLARVEVTLP